MAEESVTISCPSCGNQFIPAEQALQQCPACREQFFVQMSDETSDEEARAILELEQHFRDTQDRLNQKQIRMVQLEKRSFYRKRTWVLVLALGMLGLAGQLIWQAVEWVLDRPSYAFAYLILALGLIVGSIRFFAKAMHYDRLARKASFTPPTDPPDFSTLGDGSQIVANLEQMTCQPDQLTQQNTDDSR